MPKKLLVNQQKTNPQKEEKLQQKEVKEEKLLQKEEKEEQVGMKEKLQQQNEKLKQNMNIK